MFSGGNWQNTSYGVSFAVTDDLNRPDEWEQHADGHKVLPILRTVPGVIVGPGHNSVVRGPNNRELYCIYHRWTEAGRVLAIDRMDFADSRLYVAGATYTPQPCPFSPSVEGLAAEDSWRSEGGWKFSGDTATAPAAGSAELRLSAPVSFLSEFLFRRTGEPGEESAIGFAVRSENGQMDVSVDHGRCTIQHAEVQRDVPLEADFDVTAFHQARVEVDGLWARVCIDDRRVFEGRLTAPADELVLYSNDAAAEFGSFSLTEGFEDDFDRGTATLADSGWRGSECGIENHELHLLDDSVLHRDQHFAQIDLAANVRLAGDPDDFFEFGLDLSGQSPSSELRLAVDNTRNLRAFYPGGGESFPLPDPWQPREYHQYRVLVRRGMVHIYLDGTQLGEFQHTASDFRPAIFCRGAGIALDMVRATAV